MAKLIVLHYDAASGGCKLEGQPFVVPAGCPAIHLTATPKQENGQDAQHHGRALTWTANGIRIPDGDEDACVDVGPGLVCGGMGGEERFNRTVKRKPGGGHGLIFIEATLVAPDGQVFKATARRKNPAPPPTFLEGVAFQ